MFGNKKRHLSDFDSEIESHLDLASDQYREEGLDEREAHYAALRQFGNVTIARERFYEAGRWRWLDAFGRDLRHGCRMLMRQPLQSLIITGILSLGMAGTMTVFNLYNSVFLRPLPINDQSRVMVLDEIDPGTGNREPVSYSRFRAWHQHNQTFEAMGFSSQFSVNISASYSGVAKSTNVRFVTREFFDVLDIRPVLGRTFTAEECRTGEPKAVLLGFGLWKQIFNSDPAILGQTVLLDGSPSGPVIGILPDDSYPDRRGVWLPLSVDQENDSGLGPMAVGRLKEGVSVEQARVDLSRIQEIWAEQHPDQKATAQSNVIPVRKAWLDRMNQSRFELFVAIAFAVLVLVIACCNVAGAMLARGTDQSREFVMRMTLGATRGDIVRRVIAESLILVIAGSFAGIILGWYALQGILRIIEGQLPTWLKFSADGRCILFGILLVAVTTILCGLLPALHAAVPKNLQGMLQTSGSRTAGSRGKHRMMNAIIACQVALAMTVLVAAGLILRTYIKVQLIDPGFRTEGVLTYHVPLSIGAYLDENKRREFWKQHIEKVRALPGVTSAAMVSALPLTSPEGGAVRIEGEQRTSNESVHGVIIRRITPDYFTTLGIPLLLGRDFTDNDNRSESERTVIVDRSFAGHFWFGENPIGKKIQLLGSQDSIGIVRTGYRDWITVVGVVQDVKQFSLDESSIPSGIYLPQAMDAPFGMPGVIRTTGDPLMLVEGLRRSVRSIDASVPVEGIQTMTNLVYESMVGRRLFVWVYGIPALVAAILAFTGIYGITSYAVSQRTQEIGIRIALGAQKLELMRMVIGYALRLVLYGLVPGLLGALFLGRILANMLYGVSSADLLTLIAVPLLLTAAAVLACWHPAYKAINVDPMTALKCE